jgi:hypothetical protein
VDLSKRYFQWYHNGTKLGITYCDFDTNGKPLFPALSVDTDECCCLNFGGKPFAYPVDEGEEEEAWREFISMGHEKTIPLEFSSGYEEEKEVISSSEEEEEEEEEEDREAMAPDFVL